MDQCCRCKEFYNTSEIKRWGGRLWCVNCYFNEKKIHMELMQSRRSNSSPVMRYDMLKISMAILNAWQRWEDAMCTEDMQRAYDQYRALKQLKSKALEFAQ